jgi:hypothetical protein
MRNGPGGGGRRAQVLLERLDMMGDSSQRSPPAPPGVALSYTSGSRLSEKNAMCIEIWLYDKSKILLLLL